MRRFSRNVGFLSRGQAAEKLGVSVSGLDKLAKVGKIRFVLDAKGQRRFPQSVVEKETQKLSGLKAVELFNSLLGGKETWTYERFVLFARREKVTEERGEGKGREVRITRADIAILVKRKKELDSWNSMNALASKLRIGPLTFSLRLKKHGLMSKCVKVSLRAGGFEIKIPPEIERKLIAMQSGLVPKQACKFLTRKGVLLKEKTYKYYVQAGIIPSHEGVTFQRRVLSEDLIEFVTDYSGFKKQLAENERRGRESRWDISKKTGPDSLKVRIKKRKSGRFVDSKEVMHLFIGMNFISPVEYNLLVQARRQSLRLGITDFGEMATQIFVQTNIPKDICQKFVFFAAFKKIV